MKIIEIISIIMFIVGVILLWISFTNEENVTGMWVAGHDFRDKEFKNSERFSRKTYIVLRIIGIILMVPAILILIFG